MRSEDDVLTSSGHIGLEKFLASIHLVEVCYPISKMP